LRDVRVYPREGQTAMRSRFKLGSRTRIWECPYFDVIQVLKIEWMTRHSIRYSTWLRHLLDNPTTNRSRCLAASHTSDREIFNVGVARAVCKNDILQIGDRLRAVHRKEPRKRSGEPQGWRSFTLRRYFCDGDRPINTPTSLRPSGAISILVPGWPRRSAGNRGVMILCKSYVTGQPDELH